MIANNQQTVQSIMNIALRLGIMLVVIGTVVGAIGTIGKAVSGVSAAIKTARLVWLAFNTVFAATPIGMDCDSDCWIDSSICPAME